MAIKQPIPGPGHFRWNKGGWFGSQIGGTAWLLPSGLIFLYEDPPIGGIWLVIFAAVNSIGYWMWHGRDRLDPFRATQAMLLVCGLGGLIAVGSLDLLRPGASLPDILWEGGHLVLGEDRRFSLRQAYLFFLIGIPAMMGWFAMSERAGRKARARYDGTVQPTEPKQTTSDMF